jgi:hypothetical protein
MIGGASLLSWSIEPAVYIPGTFILTVALLFISALTLPDFHSAHQFPFMFISGVLASAATVMFAVAIGGRSKGWDVFMILAEVFTGFQFAPATFHVALSHNCNVRALSLLSHRGRSPAPLMIASDMCLFFTAFVEPIIAISALGRQSATVQTLAYLLIYLPVVICWAAIIIFLFRNRGHATEMNTKTQVVAKAR